MNLNDFRIIYERFKSSGLNITHFCENEGYSKSSFYYWRKKFLSKESSNCLSPITISSPLKTHPLERLVPQVNQDNSSYYKENVGQLTVEIKHPNGLEIKLSGEINPLVLTTIIKQL